jgi:tetratricopeptide (TPR) repeat protein
LKREPVEVTYRTLTYYFDDQIAKIVEPATVEPASAGKMPELPAAKELEMSTNPALAEQHITVFSLDTAVAQLTSHLGPPPDLAREGDEKQLLTPPHANQTDDSTVLSSLQIEHTESVSEENNLAPSRAVNEAERSSAAEPNTLISSSPPAATSESEAKGPAPSDHAAAVKGYEYFEAGRQRFNEGDLKGAVAAYLQSIELQPDSVEAHLSLGLTYLKMGKNKDAAKAFKESVRLGPEVAEAQYGLGLAYFRLARQRDAAEAFKRATTLSPKMAKAHYGLALAYQELGKTDALTEEFRILQTLDAALAKQLSMTFPESIVPCNSASRCK